MAKKDNKYVLIVTEGYPTDKYPLCGIFAYDQALALKAAGYNVVLACVDLRSIRRTREWGYEYVKKDGMDIYCVNIPLGRVPKRILYTTGRIAFNGLYRRIEHELGKPEVIHAHFFSNAYFVLDIKIKEGTPFVITEHASGLLAENIDPYHWRMARESYALSDAMIAVSGSLSKRIKSEFNIAATVIPNIVRTDIFSYSSAQKQRNEIISVGALITRKRMDVLVRAFAKIMKKYPEARLTIIGEGPERKNITNLIEQMTLSGSVTLTGNLHRTRIAEYFAQSAFFVLASKFETFGVVYIEAMAAGLPVIATRCGGPEDFVDDASGMLVPVDDEDALAEAMDVMYNTEYDRDAITQRAKTLFSPESVAAAIGNVYKGIGIKN